MKTILLSLMLIASSSPLFAGIHQKVDGLMEKGDFKKAEKIARKAANKNPDNPEALCALACVFRNLAYKEILYTNLGAAGIKDKGSVTVKITKDNFEKIFQPMPYYDRDIFSKAEKIYFEIIDKDKNYKNAYFNLMNVYATNGEFESFFKVIDLFIKNLSEESETPTHLNSYAGNLMKMDLYDEALRLYGIIIKKFPHYTYALSDMGATYATMGNYDKAHEIFSQVYSKDTKDLINTRNFFTTSVFVENFSQALALTVHLAEELNEKDFYYDAALCAAILGREYTGYLEKYIKNRQNEVKDDENDFWILTAKDMIENKDSDKKNKIELYESILYQLSTNNINNRGILVSHILLNLENRSMPLLVIGSIYDRSRYAVGILRYLKKIEEFRRTDESIMTEYDLNWNYARAYMLSEKNDKALTYLMKNFKKRNNDANVNYSIAKIYLGKNNITEAKKYLKLNSKLDDKEDMEIINRSIQLLRYLEEE